MKHLAVPAMLAAVVLAGAVFLWLGSGWLTIPLNEEGE